MLPNQRRRIRTACTASAINAGTPHYLSPIAPIMACQLSLGSPRRSPARHQSPGSVAHAIDASMPSNLPTLAFGTESEKHEGERSVFVPSCVPIRDMKSSG